MGYVPLPPPRPGAVIILEGGIDLIEVTNIGSEWREFVEGYGGRSTLRTDGIREAAEHRARMALEHAETMRQARVGTLLLLAFVVTAAVCVAQLMGLL